MDQYQMQQALGMQQQAALGGGLTGLSGVLDGFANTITYTSGTANADWTTLQQFMLPTRPIPKSASPADPPEILWLKRRVEEICWSPA